MDDGCSNDGLVDRLRSELLAFDDLRVLSHVEKFLVEHQPVLNELTNDILSAICNINEDLIGKGRFTVYVWATEHQPLHEFLEEQIKDALKVVVGRRGLSSTEAERLAAVWRFLDRYPYVTWGMDSIVASFEEALQRHLQQLLGSGLFQGCMDALKVIKPLPAGRMEPQLSCVLNKIATLTKKADTQVLEAAKLALLSCLNEKEFGIKCLQTVIQSLRDVLEQETQGDELVNFVLSTCMTECGRCLKDLVACVESAEQKNKGRKKYYTFDSLKLMAENVILQSQALELVSLVTALRKEKLSNEETRSILEESLENISDGLANNSSYPQEDLFGLMYDLLGIRIGDELAGFALDLLIKRLKKKNKMEELLNQQELLDPFVPVVIGFLSNTQFVSSALSSLDLLMSKKLPSLTPEAEGDSYDEGESKVLDLAVNSENEEIRLIGKKILLDFLHKDSLRDEQRLLKHTGYLLEKLRSDNQNETADRAIDILYAIFTVLVETGRKQFLNKHAKELFGSLLSLMPPEVDNGPSPTGDLIKWLVKNIDREHAGPLLVKCLDSFEECPAAVSKLMVFFMETFKRNINKNFESVWKKMEIADSDFHKYCSLVMLDKVLEAFPQFLSRGDSEDMWTLVFGFLVQPDARLKNIRVRLLEGFSDAFEKRTSKNIQKGLGKLKRQVERMTLGNSVKRRLGDKQEIDVQRKKRK